MNSCISWVGGKFYLANRIIPLFPEHTCYVEPFGGAMHVLFKKPKIKCEVYNDIDSRLYNFWQVVKDIKKLQQLLDMLEFSLYSRQLFKRCLRDMHSGTDVQQAFCFYIVNQQCFGGKMTTWGYEKSDKAVGQIIKLIKFKERLTGAHDRINTVQIENDDFKNVIERYDTPSTLFYCDPPYLFNGVRGDTKVYKHEMSTEQHRTLVETLKRVKGKFILSGYDNTLYDVFRRIPIGEACMNVHMCDGVRRRKTEFVWVNF